MTGMPEAALAREIGLCYAAIAVVANCAAGRGDERRRHRDGRHRGRHAAGCGTKCNGYSNRWLIDNGG